MKRFLLPALLLGFMTLWVTTMLNPAALIARTITERTGIRERHLAAPGEMTSDLAIAHRKTEASPAVRAFILHTRN